MRGDEITLDEPPNLLEFTSTRGSARMIGRYILVFINLETTHVEFSMRRVSPEFRRIADIRAEGG